MKTRRGQRGRLPRTERAVWCWKRVFRQREPTVRRAVAWRNHLVSRPGRRVHFVDRAEMDVECGGAQAAGDDDFVAKEIDLAFQAGARLTVIPVFVDNAEPPEPSHLPPNLRSLPSCHGERLRPTHLLDDIAHLIERLEEIVIPRRRCATYPKADHGKSRLRSRSTRTRRRPPSARRRRHPTRIIIGWSSKRPRTWWFSSEQG